MFVWTPHKILKNSVYSFIPFYFISAIIQNTNTNMHICPKSIQQTNGMHAIRNLNLWNHTINKYRTLLFHFVFKIHAYPHYQISTVSLGSAPHNNNGNGTAAIIRVSLWIKLHFMSFRFIWCWFEMKSLQQLQQNKASSPSAFKLYFTSFNSTKQNA